MEDIDQDKLAKIIFIHNALENGWTISKSESYYIFKKHHNNKKEVFQDPYYLSSCHHFSIWTIFKNSTWVG